VNDGWQGRRLVASAPSAYPYFALNPDGVGAVVWATEGDFQGTSFDLVDGAGPIDLIENEPDLTAQNGRIAIDHRGNALFTWPCLSETQNFYCASRYSAAAGWSQAEKISQLPGEGQAGATVFDGQGRATLVWTHHEDGAGTVHTMDFR
jgi:hypothetical protein